MHLSLFLPNSNIDPLLLVMLVSMSMSCFPIMSLIMSVCSVSMALCICSAMCFSQIMFPCLSLYVLHLCFIRLSCHNVCLSPVPVSSPHVLVWVSVSVTSCFMLIVFNFCFPCLISQIVFSCVPSALISCVYCLSPSVSHCPHKLCSHLVSQFVVSFFLKYLCLYHHVQQ